MVKMIVMFQKVYLKKFIRKKQRDSYDGTLIQYAQSIFVIKGRVEKSTEKQMSKVNKYGEWLVKPPVANSIQSVYHPPPLPPVVRPNEPLQSKISRLSCSWIKRYSRKRGILETDLILSTFAKKHLNSLSQVQLQEYDELLHENDWNIYYWATKAQSPPSHIQKMSILPLIQLHAENREKKLLTMPPLE